MLLAIREWERERMEITNGNGKWMGIHEVKSGIGNGNWNEPVGMRRNGINKVISAHLYYPLSHYQDRVNND